MVLKESFSSCDTSTSQNDESRLLKITSTTINFKSHTITTHEKTRNTYDNYKKLTTVYSKHMMMN